jgi:hypothetical protein
MAGEFYTEVDIVDLAQAGGRQLHLGPEDRMTDLARERAAKEGIIIVGAYQIPEQAARQAASMRYAPPLETKSDDGGSLPAASDIRQRVRQAVGHKLGDQVDQELLDRILDRVLDQLGVS